MREATQQNADGRPPLIQSADNRIEDAESADGKNNRRDCAFGEPQAGETAWLDAVVLNHWSYRVALMERLARLDAALQVARDVHAVQTVG